MMRREVFLEAGGFDPSFGDGLADVDLCLRLRERGRRVVWTPHATLKLAVSREQAGPYAALPESEATKRFRTRWPHLFDRGDPFYNPHLTRTGWDYSLAPPASSRNDEETW
jgi:O-antigen biosynthesis protein